MHLEFIIKELIKFVFNTTQEYLYISVELSEFDNF